MNRLHTNRAISQLIIFRLHQYKTRGMENIKVTHYHCVHVSERIRAWMARV